MMPPACAPSRHAAALAAALALGACGTEGVEVADDDPAHEGAVLFAERCAGCHTLDAAGAEGSANRALRNQGPNLDERDRDARGRALRDPQRRLLRRDHAAEHRRRRRGRGGRRVRRRERGHRGRPPATPGDATERVGEEEADAADAGRALIGRPRQRYEPRSLARSAGIREDPGPAREALARRGAAEELDELLELDARRRELLPEVEIAAREAERGIG